MFKWLEDACDDAKVIIVIAVLIAGYWTVGRICDALVAANRENRAPAATAPAKPEASR